MKNKLLLLLALMMFTFSYCHEKISVYKTDLQELKINSTIFEKKYNGKTYTIKCEVKEAFLGEISEITYQIIEGPDYEYDNLINENKTKINKIFTLLSKIVKANPPSGTEPIAGLEALSCFGTCVKCWCFNTSTTAGAALCYGDCVLECWGY